MALIAAFGSGPARAHHGRDFLLSQTAALPHSGQLFVIPRQDLVAAEDDEIELEPALLWGATDRLALEVHAHLAQSGGGGFSYESTTPAVHLLLTPADRPWGLALSVEYELDHRGEAGDGPDEAAPEDHGDSHHGQAGGDSAEVRLAWSRRWDRRRVALNLIAAEEQVPGAKVEWEYSAGLRTGLRRGLAWGLEAQGGLEHDLAREALLALYWEPGERCTFNVGAGTGFSADAPDFILRTGLILRLR